MPIIVSTGSYWNISAAKKPTISRLTRLVASSPESNDATVSLISILDTMSPLNRCAKNSIGSRSTCQKKRLDPTVASLVSMASSPRCCSHVRSPVTTTVSAIANSSGRTHAAVPLNQDCVDEHAREDRHDDARQDQGERGENRVDEAETRAGQTAAQGSHDRRRRAAGLELRALLEDERNAGERLVEFLLRHDTRPLSRIVQVDLPAAEALDDHEVIEVPEGDERQGHVAELRRLLLVALAQQAVAPRRLDDIERLAAVARHAALDSQFLERHEAAEVAEHHRQRCCAAFDGLHLDDRRRPRSSLHRHVS